MTTSYSMTLTAEPPLAKPASLLISQTNADCRCTDVHLLHNFSFLPDKYIKIMIPLFCEQTHLMISGSSIMRMSGEGCFLGQQAQIRLTGGQTMGFLTITTITFTWATTSMLWPIMWNTTKTGAEVRLSVHDCCTWTDYIIDILYVDWLHQWYINRTLARKHWLYHWYINETLIRKHWWYNWYINGT